MEERLTTDQEVAGSSPASDGVVPPVQLQFNSTTLLWCAGAPQHHPPGAVGIWSRERQGAQGSAGPLCGAHIYR